MCALHRSHRGEYKKKARTEGDEKNSSGQFAHPSITLNIWLSYVSGRLPVVPLLYSDCFQLDTVPRRSGIAFPETARRIGCNKAPGSSTSRQVSLRKNLSVSGKRVVLFFSTTAATVRACPEMILQLDGDRCLALCITVTCPTTGSYVCAWFIEFVRSEVCLLAFELGERVLYRTEQS